MANTYTLISSNVLSSSAASVTFSAIPSTYTDLVLRFSARSDLAGSTSATIPSTINGTTTGYSYTAMLGTGSAAQSFRGTSTAFNFNSYVTAATATADTFGSGEFYYSNYASSNYKVISSDVAQENNTTAAFRGTNANLWQNTAAITSVTLTLQGSSNFVSGSSFYLYGIKNS